jgi:methionyl-tRNA formyltransferase
MKIVFFGTPSFSVPILNALIEEGHQIVCVYCQPPSVAGRGQKVRNSPVHVRANELGLLVRHPSRLSDDKIVHDFLNLEADVGVVVAYGLLLPKEILDGPRFGCLNVHASLLPRWRGAAPIQRAIMAGDPITGVCIMRMDQGLDTGAIVDTFEVEIGERETSGELHERLSNIGANLIVHTISKISDIGDIQQSKQGTTYAQKILKNETLIDWRQPAIEIDRVIRAMSPWPGAWFHVNGERLKLLGSYTRNIKADPGEILEGFTVACGVGAVSITSVQKPGKRVVTTKEFLMGNSLPKKLL